MNQSYNYLYCITNNINHKIYIGVQRNPVVARFRSGKGKIYIHNPITQEAKRFNKEESIPIGWLRGTGSRKK